MKLTVFLKPTARSLLLSLLLTAGAGCSLQKIALDQTAKVLLGAMPAFEKDWDYEFVGAALPGNIKMMEGLLEGAPNNPDLLYMLAQAYTAYALIFMEDRHERAEEMTPEADHALMRAKEMYMRGHRYGLRLLEQRQESFRGAFDKGGPALDAALKACTAEEIHGLFWTAMPLAGAVNLAREDVEMIAQMPRARAMIARVLQLDETYYHAAGHMIFGALFGSMGSMVGGDPKKGKEHFEKALKITDRKFLIIQVMYAKTVAVQLQKKALFDALLDEVLKADLSLDPAQKLANVAAKRQARRLKERTDELF